MTRKQFLKLIIISLLSIIPLYFLTASIPNILLNIVNSLSNLPYILLPLSSGIVIYLITYTDSVSSRLSSVTNGDSEKINLALKSLTALNQEAISNLILLFILLVVVLSTGDFSESTSIYDNQKLTISVKLSAILIMLYVSAIQTLALHTAMNFRETVGKQQLT